LPVPVGVAAATSKLKEEEEEEDWRSTRKACAGRTNGRDERRTSDT